MSALVHVYTGDGKGKTTAAIGLGVRAWGRGFKVLMVQFLKGQYSGEIKALESLSPGFDLCRGKEIVKFTWQMNEQEKKDTGMLQQELFAHTRKQVIEGAYDLLILDEIMAAVTTGMIPLSEVTSLIKNKPEALEIVMTGRDAPMELITLADYVSEIRAVKHPMEKGIPPRKGIES